MDAMSGDDHGVAQVTDLRKREGSSSKGKRSSSKKNKKEGFEVVRCKSLFPLDLKYYFPSPVNSLLLGDRHDEIEIDFPVEIKHTYPPGIENSDLKIVQGMRLEEDVVSLLSNGGKRDYLVRNNGVKVPVDSITGKYLLICCFTVPLLTDDEAAYTCRAMIAAYSHLTAANNNHNFEMVMVAKMTSATMIDDDEEAAFNRFFAAFPCLAIPFSDTWCREFVCYSLGLRNSYEQCSALVLDPDQMVLQTDDDCLFRFGAASFPFNADRMDALYTEAEEMKFSLDFIQREVYNINSPPLSLVELLGGNHLLHKSNSEASVSVSELSKKKCVGLYLCYDGRFMKQLDEVHQECIAKNLEFEIVVVYIAVHSDTASFVNAVKLGLEKHKISSWWLMPFVDEVSRRMSQLFYGESEDNLIILADNAAADGAELMGKHIILFEPWIKYPFTRKNIFDDTLRRLRSLTPESLLSVRSYELVRSNSSKGPDSFVPVSKLKGKKVLLYMDWYRNTTVSAAAKRTSLFKLLLDSYKRIRKDYPHCKVVFVPLDETYPMNYSQRRRAVPWLELPFGAAIEGEVVERLFPCKQKWTSLIAFGEDGLIRSRCAQDRLRANNGSLFDDTLHREIVDHLDELIWGD